MRSLFFLTCPVRIQHKSETLMSRSDWLDDPDVNKGLLMRITSHGLFPVNIVMLMRSL